MHRKPQDLTTMVLTGVRSSGSSRPTPCPGRPRRSARSSSTRRRATTATSTRTPTRSSTSIEGTGRQTVGDGPEFDIVAGDAIWVPKGTLHSTFNTGWKPLRLIATYTPGGEEQALRTLPDFAELPAGENPVWHQRK